MLCDEVQRFMNRYIDGEVSRTVAAAVNQHLAGCAVCRAAADRLWCLDDQLELVADAPVPAGFSARVLNAARRRLLDSRADCIPVPNRRRRLRMQAIAATLVGLSVGSWMASDTWRISDSDDLAGGVARWTSDIGGFYGAGPEVDVQRPLLQAYMGVVDRHGAGE